MKNHYEYIKNWFFFHNIYKEFDIISTPLLMTLNNNELIDIWNFVHRTHWGRVTHICVAELGHNWFTDNGLSPVRRQAVIWTNAGILLIGPLGTNFSEILIGIQTFSFKKLHLKTSSAKWRLFCLGLNELRFDKSVWVSDEGGSDQ